MDGQPGGRDFVEVGDGGAPDDDCGDPPSFGCSVVIAGGADCPFGGSPEGGGGASNVTVTLMTDCPDSVAVGAVVVVFAAPVDRGRIARRSSRLSIPSSSALLVRAFPSSVISSPVQITSFFFYSSRPNVPTYSMHNSRGLRQTRSEGIAREPHASFGFWLCSTEIRNDSGENAPLAVL